MPATTLKAKMNALELTGTDRVKLEMATHAHLNDMLELLERRGVLLDAFTFKRDMEVKLDWGRNRTRSCGGMRAKGLDMIPAISIGMLRAVVEGDEGYVPEYKSFQGDRTIGARSVYNREHAILMVTAHELAHAVQFTRECVRSYAGVVSDELPNNDAPHGRLFKTVYAELREHYVNPLLDGARDEYMATVAVDWAEPRMAARTQAEPEVASHYKNRAQLFREMIRNGYDNAAIIEAANRHFPERQNDARQLSWYRSDVKRRG